MDIYGLALQRWQEVTRKIQNFRFKTPSLRRKRYEPSSFALAIPSWNLQWGFTLHKK